MAVTTQRRSTSQRTAITAALARTEEFTSAQDLHAAMRASGVAIGLATVYRALQEMSERGDVDALRNESGEVLYRRCAQSSHHHHLVCRSCGHTQEVDSPRLEEWTESVAAQYGYTDLDHHVELFGLCAACAAKAD